ncbi:MAG: hypothetical protein AAF726_23875 [Planctomycetota bacterium]
MIDIPRLCLVGLGAGPRPDDDVAAFALAIASAATRARLEVAAFVVSTDRAVPEPSALAELAAVTGGAVHRLDPTLMSAPSIQRVVARVGRTADLCLLVATAASMDARNGSAIDVLAALECPVALCADVEALEGGDGELLVRLDDARRFLARHRVEGRALTLLAGASPLGTWSEALLGATTFVRVDGWSGRLRVPVASLVEVLHRARVAPPLPPRPTEHAPPNRALVGVVIDDCFDLYDEEGLLQFEAAGARFVAVSALDDDVLPDVDGLIVGDGRVEEQSAALARCARFRRSVRDAVRSGLPTIAAGGGFAYLTRGIRSTTGAFHPFAGALDAESVAIPFGLPRGHVEVETTVDTVVGPSGSRVRGYLQRGWLVRGLEQEERGVYATLSGPPDEGCAHQHLAAFHFRPYWPSCPDAARTFVDRCVLRAAARERGLLRT